MSFCLCFGERVTSQATRSRKGPLQELPRPLPQDGFHPIRGWNTKDTLPLKGDRSFRLQMLSAPFLTKRSSRTEQIVFIFKKQKPQLPSCTEWVISEGFDRGHQQAGIHFSRVTHQRGCVCRHADPKSTRGSCSSHSCHITRAGRTSLMHLLTASPDLRREDYTLQSAANPELWSEPGSCHSHMQLLHSETHYVFSLLNRLCSFQLLHLQPFSTTLAVGYNNVTVELSAVNNLFWWHSLDVTGTFEERNVSPFCSFVNHDFLFNSISCFLACFKIPSINKMKLPADTKTPRWLYNMASSFRYDGV